jgi:hypothetical protein
MTTTREKKGLHDNKKYKKTRSIFTSYKDLYTRVILAKNSSTLHPRTTECTPVRHGGFYWSPCDREPKLQDCIWKNHIILHTSVSHFVLISQPQTHIRSVISFPFIQQSTYQLFENRNPLFWHTLVVGRTHTQHDSSWRETRSLRQKHTSKKNHISQSFPLRNSLHFC